MFVQITVGFRDGFQVWCSSLHMIWKGVGNPLFHLPAFMPASTILFFSFYPFFLPISNIYFWSLLDLSPSRYVLCDTSHEFTQLWVRSSCMGQIMVIIFLAIGYFGTRPACLERLRAYLFNFVLPCIIV